VMSFSSEARFSASELPTCPAPSKMIFNGIVLERDVVEWAEA
jgi:hypothetical protein